MNQRNLNVNIVENVIMKNTNFNDIKLDIQIINNMNVKYVRFP